MSTIRNGKFIKEGKPSGTRVNTEWKRWNHATQRADHAQDLLQRYRNGKPNGEWIRSYPEEARAQFTDAQIREYGNSYD